MKIDELAEAFPLAWPLGKPRSVERESGQFGVTIDKQSTFDPEKTYKKKQQITVGAALSRLRDQLKLLGVETSVISTNMPIRRDGLPMSGRAEPLDPGVACYFVLEGVARVLAGDKFDRIADNIAAIAAHIDALRGQARWGIGDLAQAFAGYKALPAFGGIRPWWELLGFKAPPASLDMVKAKRTELLVLHHPDRGGNMNQAAEINAAYGDAEKYFAKKG